MKKFFISLVAVSLLLALVLVPGCAKPKLTEIAYGGTSSASGGYAWCVALAETINKNVPEAHVTVIETGASIENLHLLHRGDINMGMATLDSAARAYHDMGEFKGEGNPDLRALWPWCNFPHNVFVTEESGVKSIYELEGKKFGCGMTGSATEAMSVALFDACGIHPDWFRGGTAANRDATKNRQIIGYVKSVCPDPSVMDVASVIPIRLLPISDADFAKAQAKYPGMFSRGYVPANCYRKGVPPTDIPSFTVIGMTVTTNKLSQDLVYKMAKAVYENREALGKSYKPCAKPLAGYPKDFVEDVTIYLHAGVVQLCKELGVEVPAKVIPPEYK